MIIPIDSILPNPEQPRKYFDKTQLIELSDSIRENGVIEPIVVEESAGGMYILHDGERRLRAAKMAGLSDIPASVTPALNGSGKEQRLVRAMVANLQRADLNPIEEAQAFKKMHEELGMTFIEIGHRLGIYYARVSSRIELLKLEKPVQKLIAEGRISKDLRLVKELLDIPSPAQVKLAQILAERNTSLKASLEACKRLSGTLAAEKMDKNEIPALHMAAKIAGPVKRPQWDAFAQVGRLPPWLLVEISARNVCDRCGLRDMASMTTCRGCALVEVLAEMIGRGK